MAKAYVRVLTYNEGTWYNSMGHPIDVIGNVDVTKPGKYYVSIMDGQVLCTVPYEAG
jgi:predicted house-cleaning NTP pyrophosphatase (Maf/HAM1 superfamily)